MGEFTKEIRELLDNNIDVFAGWTYPIFLESYRVPFQKKILDHYMFREIGVETVGKFIFNLRTRLNEIMPYFNKLYAAQAMPQTIIDTYKVTETYVGHNSASGGDGVTTTNNLSQTAKKLFSDTPQGRTLLTDTQFVTTINDDTATDTGTVGTVGTNNALGDNNWTRTMNGNIGVQTNAEEILKYNRSLMNVDLEVFKALNDLFMQVYAH